MTPGDPHVWWLAGADAGAVAAQLEAVGGDGPPEPPAGDAGPARLGIVDP